jgi:uncharacterized membrane-anchored protein
LQYIFGHHVDVIIKLGGEEKYMDQSLSSTTHQAQRIFTKVPEITACFWITKVLTTGMGEVFSDYLFNTLTHPIAIAIGGLSLIASLALQFSVRRYVAWIYWLAVVVVSIFGTMAADFLHSGLGIPFVASTTFFVVEQAIIFVAWYVVEKTLAIHSIHTYRREAFYWATVLGTFALGTAAGDMTASTMHMGFLSSGILFAVLIAIPALAYWLFGLNEIFAFWFAYIMTRPLGASFSDWMSHPHGGLGLGTGPVSLGLTIVIVVLVGYLSVTGEDVQDEHPEPQAQQQTAR